MDSEMPFTDLPQALVEQMFNVSGELASNLANHISQIHDKTDHIREDLRNIIRDESEIITTQSFPTTAGVDGSYCADRLLTTDFVAMAAVAVEGLIPPKLDEPIWPKPHHFVNVESLAHDEASLIWAKATMLSMEIQLAALAPHEVVFLDGALTTPSIAFNQAYGHTSNEKLMSFLECGDPRSYSDGRERFASIETTFEKYKEILSCKRTDKITVAIPKYSRRNEICEKIEIPDYDDRGLLSLILRPGEFTSPMPIRKEGGGRWFTAKMPKSVSASVLEIERLLGRAYVIYYKPFKHFPAIRMEVGDTVAKNDSRLAMLLAGIKMQSGTPGMMEPYPTYLADKMVRHLSTALPAIKGLSVMEIASKWKGNIGDVYLAMHSYRT